MMELKDYLWGWKRKLFRQIIPLRCCKSPVYRATECWEGPKFFFCFFFYRIYLHIAQEKQPGNGLRRPLQVVSNLAVDDVGPPQEWPQGWAEWEGDSQKIQKSPKNGRIPNPFWWQRHLARTQRKDGASTKQLLLLLTLYTALNAREIYLKYLCLGIKSSLCMCSFNVISQIVPVT